VDARRGGGGGGWHEEEERENVCVSVYVKRRSQSAESLFGGGFIHRNVEALSGLALWVAC